MISTDPILRIRRSAVPGKKPTENQLLLGELGLNILMQNYIPLEIDQV